MEEGGSEGAGKEDERKAVTKDKVVVGGGGGSFSLVSGGKWVKEARKLTSCPATSSSLRHVPICSSIGWGVNVLSVKRDPCFLWLKVPGRSHTERQERQHCPPSQDPEKNGVKLKSTLVQDYLKIKLLVLQYVSYNTACVVLRMWWYPLLCVVLAVSNVITTYRHQLSRWSRLLLPFVLHHWLFP